MEIGWNWYRSAKFVQNRYIYINKVEQVTLWRLALYLIVKVSGEISDKLPDGTLCFKHNNVMLQENKWLSNVAQGIIEWFVIASKMVYIMGKLIVNPEDLNELFS